MEKSLFLLQDWLPIGIAVMVFFGTGLLLAKALWGLHARRLATALNENMHCADNWSSLAKDLRSNWKADRRLWEKESSQWEEQSANQDKTNLELITEVTRLRSEEETTTEMQKKLGDAESNSREFQERASALEKLITANNNALSKAQSEMAVLRIEYDRKTDELTELQAKIDEGEQSEDKPGQADNSNEESEPTAPTTVNGPGSSDEELRRDIIDAMDEMADVRRGYNKKVDELSLFKGKIEELETAVKGGQNEEDKTQNLLPPPSKTVDNLQDKLDDLKGELKKSKRESAKIADALAEKSGLADFLTSRIGEIETALSDRYNEVNKLRSELKEREIISPFAASKENTLESQLKERKPNLSPASSKKIELENDSNFDRMPKPESAGKIVASEVGDRTSTNRVAALASRTATRKSSADDTSLLLYFDEGADRLDSSELTKIDQATRAVRKLGVTFRVTVAGFANAEGSPAFIESLSARRADTVRERLIGNGVSLSKIDVQGRGRDTQFAGNENESWKARRVEVVFAQDPIADPAEATQA